MERSGGDLFIFPSLEELVAKTYFIGFFVVLGHDEHDANDSPNQASYIWEVLIHFVEFSIKCGLRYGLLKANLNHWTLQWRRRLRRKDILDSHNCLLLHIFKRHETWVCFDCILPDEPSNYCAQLTGEEKNIPILNIFLLINRIASINERVDNWDNYCKLPQLCLNSCKHNVVHASSVSCTVASI